MGGPQTTISSSQPNPAFMAAYQALVAQAQGVAAQPLQQYTGDVVAGFSPDQLAAMESIRDIQGGSNSYINSAAEHYGQATTPVNTQDAANATWNGVNSQLAQGQQGSHDAAHATWDAVQGYGQGAINAADKYGEAGIRAADQAASEASGIAAAGGQQANAIAGGAGTQAQQYANVGTGIALNGAMQGAQRANTAAGTDVWSQLPQFQSGINQFMTPYNSQVVDSTRAMFDNQNAQDQQRLKSNAISQGAWGGDRAGVAQGIAAGQQALAQAPVLAQLQAQGFRDATAQYNTDKSLQAQLAAQRAGLMSSTALGGGQLESSAGLGAGQLGSSTALGAGNLGSTTALGASGQGINAALGGGQLRTGANSAAGQMGVNANLGAGQMAASTGTALMNNALQSGIAGANTLGSTGTALMNNSTQNQQYNNMNAMNAGQGIAGLGNQYMSNNLQGIGALMQSGAQQQQADQAQLNVPYQQFLQQQQYPFQATNWLSGIVSGLGSLAGGTSSTTQPGPNLFSQLLGAGTTLGSAAILASDRRVKEDISKVGKTNDGQPIYRFRYKGDPTMRMGLMAQDVEKSHPDAVETTGGGIKAVDYRKATASSVRRAGGGGIPDLSLSFLPEIGGGAGIRGSGPPAPPTPHQEKQDDDGMKMLMSIMGSRIGKGKGSPSYDANMDNFGGPDTALDSFWTSPASETFYRGGGIAHRASGGGTGGSITSARGIAIPMASTAPRTFAPTAARLTHAYGNNPNDADGKSILPHSTYVPPVGPWSAAPIDPNASFGGGGGDDSNFMLRRGGGIISRARAGHIDEDQQDDPPGAIPDLSTSLVPEGDDAALGPVGSGITGPPPPPDVSRETPDDESPDGGLPFNRFPIEQEPRVGDTGSGYEPPQLKDHTEEDKKAPLYALMAAGLGMMAGKSPNALSNIGEGGKQGLKTFLEAKQQQTRRDEREEALVSTGAYRRATIAQAAKKWDEQIKVTKDHNTALEGTAAKRAELEAQRIKDAKDKAGRPDWKPAGVDGKGNVVMFDANSTGEQPRFAHSTDVRPKPTGAAAGPTLSTQALDDLARRGLKGEIVSQFIGNDKANKAAVLNRMSEIAHADNIAPAEITAAVVNLQADKAGARTLAQVQGRVEKSVVEADKFADNALKMSLKVNRGQFMPVNKAILAWRNNTGDPDTIAFGFANNSLANAYASAVGQGTKTVQDTEEALRLLNTAQSQEQYAAAIRVLKMETHAAQLSPEVVRQRMLARITGGKPLEDTFDTNAISTPLPVTVGSDGKPVIDRAKIDPNIVYQTKQGPKTGREIIGVQAP